MRSLSGGLLAAQQAGSGDPDISLTINATNYASRKKRIQHIERPYGGRAVIVLDNHDQGITTDLRGKEVDIGYGFSGEDKSKAAPLWVLTQRDISLEGVLAVQLECIDIWLKLSLLRIITGGGVQLDGTITGTFSPGMKVTGQTSGATGTVIYVGEGYIAVGNSARTFSVAEEVQSDIYSDTKMVVDTVADFGGGSSPAWNGDKTILQIIQQLTSGVVSVVLDSSDGIVDVYKPHYETQVNARIIDIIQDLMDKTTCAIRMENDGDLHIFDITSAPGSPDYSYDSDHVFISDIRDISSILPNRIIVINAVPTATEVTTYTGSAQDDAAYARFGVWVTQIITAPVLSDEEAAQVAASRLSRAQKEATRGSVVVPMNCGQELFDYVRITDTRADIDYYGWVGSLEHNWESGIYRLTVGLGGLTGGERIKDEEEYPLPNIIPPIGPPVTQLPIPGWVMPAAIQGFQHDLHFVADDQDTVSWGSGTIKFYDGTTQAVAAGNTGDVADTAVRYIYFDLADASPNVLKVTDNYLNVMSLKTGVLCLMQKGSAAGIYATVIPSYGKEPLITADVIYLTGLLDLLPDGTYGKVLSTCISAGRILLTETTGDYGDIDGDLTDIPGDLDDIADGSTYEKVKATNISAGNIKLTSVTIIDGEWYNESGVIIDADEGITLVGATPVLSVRYSEGTPLGTVYGANSTDFRLESAKRITLLATGSYAVRIYGGEVELHLPLEAQGTHVNILHDIDPYNSVSCLGSSGDRWYKVYGVPILNTTGVSESGAMRYLVANYTFQVYISGAWRTEYLG